MHSDALMASVEVSRAFSGLVGSLSIDAGNSIKELADKIEKKKKSVRTERLIRLEKDD